MTQLIFNHDEQLAQWVEVQYPECAPLEKPFTAIGIVSSGGEILGAAIYNAFRGYNINITFVTVSPRWATPGNVRAILHYPFHQLGVKRMTAIVNKKNKRARKLLEGVGFCLEGVHPYGYNGKDPSLTYGIYENKVRNWLDGQKFSVTSAAA